MTDELTRTERERLEADARYNDALTALDREIGRLGASPALTREDIERLGTTLVVFLQQITAYVDTKDREVAAVAAAQASRSDPLLDAVPDLQAQVGVLQRVTQMLKREFASTEPSAPLAREDPARPHSTAPAARTAALEGCKYLAFEDQFRGNQEDIGAKLRGYLSLFADASNVLEAGCGRGEFLALLEAAGIRARGIDSNPEMVAVARERGLDVSQADALSYLESLPDESLGGFIAVQVVEHLEPGYLVRLVEAAFDKLRPGAPIVLETVNPACWLAFFSSYIRDFTHVRPVHPETLQYLLRASGFNRVSIRYSVPVPEHMKMQPIALPAETLAASDPTSRALVDASRTVNGNAAILNNLLFSHLDYAALGYRS